jgi:hypothetical protein
MIPNWNRLEEWLWHTDQLRRMLEFQERTSPFGPTPPAQEPSGVLPSQIGNALGEL